MSTDWSLLSRLLDESLALPAAQRATWLAALEGEAATLRPRLQALLQRGADAAAQGFLERPPDFTLPAATRYGVLRDSIKLSDYRGNTVVLAFFFKARTKG